MNSNVLVRQLMFGGRLTVYSRVAPDPASLPVEIDRLGAGGGVGMYPGPRWEVWPGMGGAGGM